MENLSIKNSLFIRYIIPIAVILISVTVFISLYLDLSTFCHLSFKQSMMKINAAFIFIIIGLSMLIISNLPRFNLTACFFAVFVIISGLLTLLQDILKVNLCIDDIFIKDIYKPLYVTNPNRMSPLAATNFILTGTAILLLLRKKRHFPTILAFFQILITLPYLIFYLYNNGKELFSEVFYTQMAESAAVLFIVVSVWIVIVHSDEYMVRLLTKETYSGSMRRRFLLYAISAPIIIHYLIEGGRSLGFYDESFKKILLLLIDISLMSYIILKTGDILDNLETKRKIADDEFRSIARFPHENPYPVMRISFDYKLLFCNPSGRLFTELIFISKDGDFFFNLTDEWKGMIDTVIIKREKMIFEVPVGQKVFSVTIIPLPELAYVNMYFFDITDRIRSEEQLLLFSQAVDSAHDLMCLVDLAGKITYSNYAFTLITGYSQDELRGFNVNMLLKDKGFDSDVIIPALKSAGYWNGEVLQLNKNGEEILIWLSITMVKNNKGKNIVSLGVGRDLTLYKKLENALKESNLTLRNLMNVISETIIMIDLDGNILEINQTGVSRLNITSVQDAYNRNLFDLLPAEVTDFKKRIVADAISSKSKVTIEHDFNGSFYWTNAYPVLDENGYVTKVIIFTVDITRQKNVERELKESLEVKDLLLTEIHHRVKNNLQLITGMIGLQIHFRKDLEPDNNNLSILRDTQDRIKSIALVHDKLYQSKGLSEIDFKGYIESVIDDLSESLGVKSRNISFVTDIEDVLLGIDKAIPCGLIISELLVNALKHAFSDGRKGQVIINGHQSQDGEVTLIIKDNGKGFPPQMDFAKSKTLGMHIVQTLIKQLNGSIEINRQNGTTFIVKFKRGIKTEKRRRLHNELTGGFYKD